MGGTVFLSTSCRAARACSSDGGLCAKLLQHRLRNWVRFESAARVANYPDAFLRALHAGFTHELQPVLDLEAGATERDCAADRHVIAEARRFQKARTCADERKTAEFKILEHLILRHPERTLEQHCGRGIEYLEVTRIENDAGGIAIAPFDPHLASVAECRHGELQRGAMRRAPSRRMTSPLR